MIEFNPCLLIPVYNPGPLIERTLDRLRPMGLPCLLVDDGSEAATAALLRGYTEAESWLTLFRQDINQGKGVAVLRGIAEARKLGFTHAVQIDADGQHTLEDVPAILAQAKAAPEALISAAPIFDESIPKARLYGRYVTHFWVWIETLSFTITDSMCGFRVYPVVATDTLASSQPIGKRMDFDTDVLVRLYWQGTPVQFLPSKVCYPDDGISHFSPLADNVRIIWMHTRLVCGMLLRLPKLVRRKVRATEEQATDATHWSQMRESGAYTGMLLAVMCYKLLGRRALRLLLYPLIGYFFIVNRPAREASQNFLMRVYEFQRAAETGVAVDVHDRDFLRPPKWSDSYHHLMQFGRSIVDRVGAWSGDMSRDEAVFTGQQHLLDCIDAGRGGVILSSHLGNAELFRGLSDRTANVKMNVLVFNNNAPHINRLMKRLNPKADVELVHISSVDPGTAMLLNEKVSNGEFIVIAADRTSPSAPDKSLCTPFLGEPAAFPQGAFILAGLLDCPVFLLFCLHQGKYHFYLEHFADTLPIPRKRRNELLQGYIERYAQRLQHYALLAPDQWFNFFDFWAVEDDSPAASERR